MLKSYISCLYMPFICPSSYTCLYVSFSIGSRSYAIAWKVSSCRTVDTGSKPRSIIMSWEWVLPWNNKIKLSSETSISLCEHLVNISENKSRLFLSSVSFLRMWSSIKMEKSEWHSKGKKQDYKNKSFHN